MYEAIYMKILSMQETFGSHGHPSFLASSSRSMAKQQPPTKTHFSISPKFPSLRTHLGKCMFD